MHIGTEIAAGRDHRIGYLDGWRGIAILVVLIGHIAPVNQFHLAMLGVDFFFVLSGRLMAEILFVKWAPLPAFYMRRFSRVQGDPKLITCVDAHAFRPMSARSKSPRHSA